MTGPGSPSTPSDTGGSAGRVRRHSVWAVGSSTTRPTCTLGSPRSATLPTVAGELLAPAGRRRLPALLVRRCPMCLRAHLHRGGPGIRRPSCKGPEYRVVALSVEGVAA